MHHGYYPRGGVPKSNQQAQVEMIDQVLIPSTLSLS